MAQQDPPATTAVQRFVINVVGLVGLVYGAGAFVHYLLGFDALSFTTAPYDWLGLSGAIRYVPPLLVLVASGVAAWAIERRASRSSTP